MERYWVVVVDDDALSLKNARALLQGEKLRISAVRSGRELLTFMKKNDPDLILMDVMMPEMDGFETYRRLREFEEGEGRSETPVIFLTGSNGSYAERRSLKIGASDFIRKPFDRDILLQRISNAIKNSKTIENLTEGASFDGLTGFLNKVSGEERLKKMLLSEAGALVMIDLDSFKLVNDIYGHDMGDEVLRSFASIVRRNTRSEDVLCRVGGDEFLLFYLGVKDDKIVRLLTERLNESLVDVCQKLMGEDFGIPIGVSVGCVYVPEQGTDYQTLFQMADKALYRVKQNGKHGFAVYDPALFSEKLGEEDLEAELLRTSRIIEERGTTGNALLLNPGAFAWVYRFMVRYLSRQKGVALELLLSLSTKLHLDDERFAGVVEAFEGILQKMLRKSDIIMRNKSNQFFLLLPEASEETAKIIVDRIIDEWAYCEHNEEVEIKYAMKSIDFRKGST